MTSVTYELDRLWNPNQPLRIIPQPLDKRINPFIDDGLRISAVMGCDLPPHQNIKVLSVRGMILDAFKRGKLEGVTELVEATSGNTGGAILGDAIHCGIHRVTLVVQPDLAVGKRDPLELLGARLIGPADNYSAIATARRMGGGGYSDDDAWGADNGVLNLDQYGNIHNADLHESYTGAWISIRMPEISLYVGGIGTGGTTIGVMKSLRRCCENVKSLGILCAPGQKIPGVRDRERMKEIRLPWEQALDAIVEIDTRQAYLTTLWLIRLTGLMYGPSGGFAHAGLLKFMKSCKDTGKPYDLDQLRIKKGPKQGLIEVAVMIPDTYRPYVDHFKSNLTAEQLRFSTSPLPESLLW
jgi:cysteine synthase